jgi:hypothetical protein
METTTIDLSWLCIVFWAVLMIPIIIFSTHSRFQYIRRLHEAQVRGAFADLESPERKRRLRHFALLALVATLVVIISIFIIALSDNILMPYKMIAIIALIVFGITAAISGYFLKREIDRRL